MMPELCICRALPTAQVLQQAWPSLLLPHVTALWFPALPCGRGSTFSLVLKRSPVTSCTCGQGLYLLLCLILTAWTLCQA